MKQEKNIVVIQPLPGIGDLFWFDAALQSLNKFFGVPLTLMTKRQSQAQHIYHGSTYVKEILWLERPGVHEGVIGFIRLVYFLRQQRFSDAWIFHKSWRYRLACQMARIPTIISYPSEKEWLEKHPIDRAHQLLKEHGVPLLKEPPFPVSDVSKKTIEKKLGSYKKPWVAIGIGGTEPSKKWKAEHWEDLAVWLFQSKKISVFLLGGAREKEEAEEMVHHIQEKGGKAYALTNLSLPESLAFLSQVHFFVGNDTGMMNGAIVQNKQTFALFLSSTPLKYRSSLTAICAEEGQESVMLSQVQKALTGFF